MLFRSLFVPVYSTNCFVLKKVYITNFFKKYFEEKIFMTKNQFVVKICFSRLIDKLQKLIAGKQFVRKKLPFEILVETRSYEF